MGDTWFIGGGPEIPSIFIALLELVVGSPVLFTKEALLVRCFKAENGLLDMLGLRLVPGPGLEERLRLSTALFKLSLTFRRRSASSLSKSSRSCWVPLLTSL